MTENVDPFELDAEQLIPIIQSLSDGLMQDDAAGVFQAIQRGDSLAAVATLNRMNPHERLLAGLHIALFAKNAYEELARERSKRDNEGDDQ
ncbi:hypothetical protein [Microbacterium rhizosphaerae]|uniref:Uncharacterized protein n=1 Tax=Microbacterium rhizosphaerae TaxID=1678237 RepID=A0ABZ0SGV3_9MICO|nr:hypothetical protein [Microbacterium rhizosphaerae]WPR88392.1 hypothetical protein SM116_11445 [Microbacterium rhizosphaerae]